MNAETGAELWSLRVDDHEGAKITGAPVVDPAGGRLYVPVTSWEEIPAPDLTYKCCTFQGSVVALDVKTGKQIWKTYTMPERPRPLKKNSAGTQLYGPAGGGVWNPPTIDLKSKIIYVGTGNTYIVVAERRRRRCHHGVRSGDRPAAVVDAHGPSRSASRRMWHR